MKSEKELQIAPCSQIRLSTMRLSTALMGVRFAYHVTLENDQTRRSIGYLYAVKMGAKFIYDVSDRLEHYGKLYSHRYAINSNPMHDSSRLKFLAVEPEQSFYELTLALFCVF